MQQKPASINLSAFDATLVGVALGKSFWFRLKLYGFAYAVVSLLLFIYASSSAIVFRLLVAWMMLSAFAVNFYTHRRRVIKPDVRLIQFAADNKLDYVLGSTYESAGIIMQVGNHNHRTQDLIHGTLYDYEYVMYWHTFSIGSGKSERPCYYAVLEIEVPKQLPNIFLDCLGNNSRFSQEVLNIYDDNERITLEGDFNKYFHLYGLRQYATDILTLINPAFMDSLKAQDKTFDIEFKDKVVYVYLPNQYTATEENVVQLYKAAEFLILALQKQLDTFNYASTRASTDLP